MFLTTIFRLEMRRILPLRTYTPFSQNFGKFSNGMALMVFITAMAIKFAHLYGIRFIMVLIS